MVRLSIPLDAAAVRRVNKTVLEIETHSAMRQNTHWANPSLESDPEMQALWLEDLRSQQKSDISQLLQFFEVWSRQEGPWELDDDQAEAIARACSTFRMHARELYLGRFDDAVFESARFDRYNDLSAREYEGLECFIVLSALQHHLVEALDPGSVRDE